MTKIAFVLTWALVVAKAAQPEAEISKTLLKHTTAGLLGDPGSMGGGHPLAASPGVSADLEWLRSMNSAERQTALGSIAAERRLQIENGLDRLDRLAPQQRARLLETYRRFEQLDPKTRAEFRNLVVRFRQLAKARQTVVKNEISALREMSDASRALRLNSFAFRHRYHGFERRIIECSSSVFPDQI